MEQSTIQLPKAPTGIKGLDEVTHGGFPSGRTTLVCGGPGCGKTVLAMEFLVRGALECNEPGLFMSFEEDAESLSKNFRSFGFDLEALVETNKLWISHVNLAPEEIVETGDFTLDGLFIRLEQGIARAGAKRVAIDTLESLFSALKNTPVLRAELARLFAWLKAKGVTSIITGQRGEEELTRHGFEGYVSDCVILLDHRVLDQISKRRFRVVKYRGSSHIMDEVPFLIGQTGLSVMPITSVGLDYEVGSERVSTGIDELDDMLGGEGYFKGSSILVSGRAGTGKSSLAAAFAVSACARGERCLYLAFEESPKPLARNMRSGGMDFSPFLENGLLTVESYRPSLQGLEEHLVTIFKAVDESGPSCVVMDPITNFVSVGVQQEVKSMLTRILDRMKERGITTLFTSLTPGSGRPDETEVHVSSLMDT